MNTSDNNPHISFNSKESGIDKFDGSFDREESGCTIFINETVNQIKDLAAGGMYMYLLCRPKNWKLNIKHLSSVFGCNKDKIYRLLDILISINLITRTDSREKGKFSSIHYRLHIRPHTNNSVQNAPYPEKPDTVHTDTVNQDAYKTKKLINKECIKHKSKSYSATDVAHVQKESHFENFWQIYPVKKNKVRSKKIWDRNKLDNIYPQIASDISNRLINDSQWQVRQYIPHPSTYLHNQLWGDEVIQSDLSKNGKPKTATEIYYENLMNQNRGNVYEHSA